MFSKTLIFSVTTIFSSDPKKGRYRPGQIARPIGIERARVRKNSETRPKNRPFCLIKKKKPLDLQIFSRIGKRMKMLHLIPNTIKNTAKNFHKDYISDDVKTASSTHRLGNI